jgi:two-component system, NarL family, response regulator NreC
MDIQIIIADDHQILRQGLRVLLEKETDMEVVAEAEDGYKTLNIVKKLTPHVVIMDVKMPYLNGIEATRQILSQFPHVKVLALSMYADRRHVSDMLKAGAHGYLFKECAFEELIRAIRLIMSNKTYLSPEVAKVVVKDYVTHDPGLRQSGFSSLTGREREVLKLIADGESTKRIAELLCIGIKTVETHRQKIIHKLGTANIADLTKYAIQEGLTTLEDVPLTKRIKEARNLAAYKGHTLGEFSINPASLLATCEKCGAHVNINPKNGAIFGEAIENDCKGS